MAKNKTQFIIENFSVLAILSIMFICGRYGSEHAFFISFAGLIASIILFYMLKSNNKWFKYKVFDNPKFSLNWINVIIVVAGLIFTTKYPDSKLPQQIMIILLLLFLLLTMFLNYRLNFKNKTQ